MKLEDLERDAHYVLDEIGGQTKTKAIHAVWAKRCLALIALLKNIRETYRPHFKGCVCAGCEAFAKLEGDL